MWKIFLVAVVAVSLSGCSIFAPHVSQAQSLERQTRALERIADALEAPAWIDVDEKSLCFKEDAAGNTSYIPMEERKK